MTTRLTREMCARCAALREALARERKVHQAQRKILAVMRRLSPERQRSTLRAAAILLGHPDPSPDPWYPSPSPSLSPAQWSPSDPRHAGNPIGSGMRS